MTPAPLSATDPVRPGRLAQADLDRYRLKGWTVVRGLLDPGWIEPLRRDALGVLAARNMPDSFLAQSREYLRGSPLHRLIASPGLGSAVEAFLGGPARVYLPFTAVKGPGQGAFSLHQDNNYTLLQGEALDCWIALVPMRPDNGCLRLVSRSHLAGTVPSVESEACAGHRRCAEVPTAWTEVEMEPGDACVFHRLAVHGSGPNRSPHPRIAYAVQFHREDRLGFWDGTWERLSDRPRHQVGPEDAFTREAQRGE
jgi:2-oxoglutarate-dependent dioxygenase